MIFSTPKNHAINMVACLFCIRESLEQEHAHPITAHIAIGSSGEGFAASIFTQHARFAQTDLRLWSDQGIDTPNNGHVTLTTLDCADTPMKSDQRARARGLNRLARSMQVEEIAHAIGAYRWGLTCRRIAFNGCRHTSYPFKVATTRSAHKQRCIAS